VALWCGSMPWEYGMGVWIGSVLWECDRESYVAQHTLILINNMSVHLYICTHSHTLTPTRNGNSCFFLTGVVVTLFQILQPMWLRPVGRRRCEFVADAPPPARAFSCFRRVRQ